MPVDQRDQLWDAVFETYYNAYYEEILSDDLLIRWQRVDDITRLGVAVTAGTSAIAGLAAFFARLDLIWLWPTLTGASALLALFHKELGVTYKLRDHGDSKRAFCSLRIELETFRYLMKIDPEFPLDAFVKQFEEYRKRYTDAFQRLRIDSLVTLGLRQKCQVDLNERLGDAIQQ